MPALCIKKYTYKRIKSTAQNLFLQFEKISLKNDFYLRMQIEYDTNVDTSSIAFIVTSCASVVNQNKFSLKFYLTLFKESKSEYFAAGLLFKFDTYV